MCPMVAKSCARRDYATTSFETRTGLGRRGRVVETLAEWGGLMAGRVKEVGDWTLGMEVCE